MTGLQPHLQQGTEAWSLLPPFHAPSQGIPPKGPEKEPQVGSEDPLLFPHTEPLPRGAAGQTAHAGGLPETPSTAPGAWPPRTSASSSSFSDGFPSAPGSSVRTWRTASPVPPTSAGKAALSLRTCGPARAASPQVSLKSKTKQGWGRCRQFKTASIFFFFK